MHLLPEKICERMSMCLITSILLYMSMPGNGMWGMIFVCLVPFLYIIRSMSFKEAALYSAFTGAVSGILIYRGFAEYGDIISYYSIVLLMVQFLFLTVGMKKGGPLASALSFTVFEFLRSLGPFGFSSNIGISLYRQSFIIRSSAFLGIYWVSFYILIINVFLSQYIVRKSRKDLILPVSVIIINIILCVLPNGAKYHDDEFSVSIIQGSIPLWMYSMEEFNRDYEKTINRIYRELTDKVLAGEPAPDIVVWPETAIHKHLLNEAYYREFFFSRSVKSSTDFILGVPYRGDTYETNSVFLVSGDSDRRYDKINTVPIVEDHYLKGEKHMRIDGDRYSFAPVICFESVFEGTVLKNTSGNADFIVVTTNDAGFKRSIIGDIHAAYSVFRAVENGRYLVRAAQTGISMIITGRGNILLESEKFRTEIYTGKIKKADGETIFSKYYSIIMLLYISSLVPVFYFRY